VTFDGAPPPGTINLGIGQRRQPRQLPPSAFCALQREWHSRRDRAPENAVCSI